MQGDSGFVCVRDGAIFRQSEPLQHFFDCPFQFAAVPEHTNATDYAEVRPRMPTLQSCHLIMSPLVSPILSSVSRIANWSACHRLL